MGAWVRACACVSVTALVASASVYISKQCYTRVSLRILTRVVSKKNSIRKLWREKNMQMSWISPRAVFTHFRDQRRAATT